MEYAIAGQRRQFEHWRREDWPTRQHVRYIGTPRDWRGGPAGRVHRVGTWYEREPELLDMADLIEARWKNESLRG